VGKERGRGKRERKGTRTRQRARRAVRCGAGAWTAAGGGFWSGTRVGLRFFAAVIADALKKMENASRR
jgi:hypothetical protein